MDGRLERAASRSGLVRLAVRLLVEEALDAEVADALGRERASADEPTHRLLADLAPARHPRAPTRAARGAG
jgi:hypothetical protein